MTILFLSRLFYPHIGGVETHVMELSKKLLADGNTVIIITEKIDDTPEKEQIAGIEVIRMDVGAENIGKKFRIWQWFWGNLSIIRQADIVHCHDVFFWYLPFKLMFPKKRVFTTFHGYESFPIRKAAIIQRKIAEKLSNGNICIGDFITKWYGTKPDFISYGAVEEPRKRKKAAHITYDAVFIGRLDTQTGIDMYSQGVKLVREIYPKFSFLIVGDGELKKQVENMGKAIGFKPHPEKYFAQGTYAFVSRYLTMLEAMIAKKLIFAAYDNPIKKDYLLMSPFAKHVIVVNNATDLKNEIVYYKTHPEKSNERINKGYAWASQQTWRKMATIYYSLWKI